MFVDRLYLIRFNDTVLKKWYIFKFYNFFYDKIYKTNKNIIIFILKYLAVYFQQKLDQRDHTSRARGHDWFILLIRTTPKQGCLWQVQ